MVNWVFGVATYKLLWHSWVLDVALGNSPVLGVRRRVAIFAVGDDLLIRVTGVGERGASCHPKVRMRGDQSAAQKQSVAKALSRAKGSVASPGRGSEGGMRETAGEAEAARRGAAASVGVVARAV